MASGLVEVGRVLQVVLCTGAMLYPVGRCVVSLKGSGWSRVPVLAGGRAVVVWVAEVWLAVVNMVYLAAVGRCCMDS